MFIRHEIIEKNAHPAAGADPDHDRDRRPGRDRAAVHDRDHDRAGGGRAALYAARAAGRNIYVREGCYLCHSQQIRALPRRGRALRPLQPRGREHVRPPVPVGHQAHRARPGARRRQVFQRLARRASAQPARVVPESLMPRYAFLADTPLDTDDIARALRAHARASACPTPTR